MVNFSKPKELALIRQEQLGTVQGVDVFLSEIAEITVVFIYYLFLLLINFENILFLNKCFNKILLILIMFNFWFIIY